MNCTYRRPISDDYPECLSIIRDGFAFDKAQRARLPDLWDHILKQGIGEAAVVVEEEIRGRAPILAFGIGVFITDAFATHLCSGARPYCAVQVLEAWLTGGSPMLGRDGVRRANNLDGLNLLVLHAGHDTRLPEGSPAYHAAARTLIQSLFAIFAGYQIKELLTETHGPVLRDDHLAGGFTLRASYDDYFVRDRNAVPPERHPYLVSVTRREALAKPGGGFSALFLYTPPCLGFTAAEQELLKHAIQGLTDEDLARTLYLSPSTVKKRWNAIYDRVERCQPDLLPPGKAEGQPGARGAEKRRHLLLYLRDHPEELRPYL